MVKLIHSVLAICFFVALANKVFSQEATTDDLKLEPEAVAVTGDLGGERLDVQVDDSEPAVAEKDESAADEDTADEDAAVIGSMIVTVRTTNGFTIHGIPTNPDMLPVSIYGSESKIPWTVVRTVRFTKDGGITVSLEDGSRLIGHTVLPFVDLEKEWGAVRIYRDKLETIERADRGSTRQSTFRSHGRPFHNKPVRRFGQSSHRVSS